VRTCLGDGQSFPLPVDLWQVGDAVIIGTKGDCYPWLQQRLRAVLSDRVIVCIKLLNGSIGYLPRASLDRGDCSQV